MSQTLNAAIAVIGIDIGKRFRPTFHRPDGGDAAGLADAI